MTLDCFPYTNGALICLRLICVLHNLPLCILQDLNTNTINKMWLIWLARGNIPTSTTDNNNNDGKVREIYNTPNTCQIICCLKVKFWICLLTLLICGSITNYTILLSMITFLSIQLHNEAYPSWVWPQYNIKMYGFQIVRIFICDQQSHNQTQ